MWLTVVTLLNARQKSRKGSGTGSQIKLNKKIFMVCPDSVRDTGQGGTIRE